MDLHWPVCGRQATKTSAMTFMEFLDSSSLPFLSLDEHQGRTQGSFRHGAPPAAVFRRLRTDARCPGSQPARSLPRVNRARLQSCVQLSSSDSNRGENLGLATPPLRSCDDPDN